MKAVVLLFALLIIFSAAFAKFSYFSDISGDEYKKLQEIANYLRKSIDGMESSEVVSSKKIFNEFFLSTEKPDYEFSLSKTLPAKGDSSPFGFGPSDPRFYGGFENQRKDLKPDNRQIFEHHKLKVDEVISSNNEASQFQNRFITNSETRQNPAITSNDKKNKTDIYFIGVLAGCGAAIIVIALVIGISFYRLRKNAKAAADVDYPAYGITGPNRAISPIWSDQKLAHSVQMYHYQHQKQQIIAMESLNNKEQLCSLSDAESEENEGDYTVYECPGLASAGEMEVKNPMFLNDPTSIEVKHEKESAEEIPYHHNKKNLL